jgi:hypothetical protein
MFRARALFRFLGPFTFPTRAPPSLSKPTANVFNLLHLGRELITEPAKVLDGSQFEYQIGQSVAALCKVAKIRSVHRLPRCLCASVRTCLSSDTLKGPCTQILTASWRHRDIAGEAMANSGSDPGVTYAAKSCHGDPIAGGEVFKGLGFRSALIENHAAAHDVRDAVAILTRESHYPCPSHIAARRVRIRRFGGLSVSHVRDGG